MPRADLVVRGGTVVTGTGSPDVEGGAVAADRDRLVFVGPAAAVDAAVDTTGARVIDARGGLITPGFVDAHTHLVFAGDRAAEFAARCAGAGYAELLAKGGGILTTVRATRAASDDELVALALPRLRRLAEQGVTTVEVKSGYGLDVESELRLLRVIRRLRAEQPLDLVPTVLPLHALPAGADREAFLARMLEELLPRAAEEGLAAFADAFVEKGAFTADEARRLAGAARASGLRLRLHVDQLTALGGAELAAELGAATADHLEEISPAGIAALAAAGISAVLVPVSTLYLRCPRYAPGRALADAGVPLALGTNCNPGSAMTESFALALSLACLGNGLSPAEAFLAATAGGARALGLSDRGRLEPGRRADIVVHAAASIDHLAYHLAVPHVRVTICAGRVVHASDLVPDVCA